MSLLIYMDGFDSRMSKPAAWPSEQKGRLAVMMSRRHTGIGADGLIFIQPSEEAVFSQSYPCLLTLFYLV